MRVTLSLVLVCFAGCTRASESVIADAEPPRPALGFSDYQTVSHEEPACAEVPMEERAAKGCLCEWGTGCVCRYRVSQRDDGCVIEFDTERPRGEPRIRLADGGVVQPLAVIMEPVVARRQTTLKPGQSATICGKVIACP